MAGPGAAGERVVVGRVIAPHGVRGAVTVESLTDEPTRFEAGSRLAREGDGRALTVASASASGKGLLVRFEEIVDREAAEALRGVYLEAAAGPRKRGRYLWHEVIGTAVEDRAGRPLGTVRDILRAGGGEVVVIAGPDGELLVPLVRAFVPRFAPRRGVIVVDTERLGVPAGAAGTEQRPGRSGRTAGRAARRRAPTLEIDVLTLFPAMLEAPFRESIPGRVQSEGIAALRVHDLRRWGLGRHRRVDDYPFGGGAGMVLRPEPVAAALDELRSPHGLVVLLDPAGERFDQALARELAGARHLVLVCGRYEGVDERIRGLVDREVSVGDVVLSGGEPAAIVVIDAVLRLLPGAIEADSVADESFSQGLLEYPQYTRPREFRDQAVPEVLVSGDHGAVARWRRREALRRTVQRRPDLLDQAALAPEDHELLSDVRREEEGRSPAPQPGPRVTWGGPGRPRLPRGVPRGDR